jgi:hypothetical protein
MGPRARAARAGGRLGLAAVLLAAALGCGRSGAPVAPERRLPQPPSEVAAAAREGALEVTWLNPDRRADGSRLRDLVAVRVFRHEDLGAGEARAAIRAGDRVPGYEPVATFRVAAPDPMVVEGRRVVFRDPGPLAHGRRYTYVLVAVDERGRMSPPSARAAVTFLPEPAPPLALTAEAGEARVRLRWRPPARFADGRPVTEPLRYEILRSTEPEGPLTSVALTDPGATTAVDAGLENDRAYTYAVRAVRTVGDTTAAGEPSARVTATPRDMTPPAPPADLVAVPTPGTVRLSWRASPEPDVAAYIVYRATGDRPLERIGSVRAPGTTFTDPGAPSGTVRYAVSAQDAGARPNESAPSGVVTVSVP